MIELIDELPETASESEYLGDVFDRLRSTLQGDWTLLATRRTTDLPATAFRKIAFITSEETHAVPGCVDDPSVVLILKQYAPLQTTHPKLIPLPLGHVRGYRPRSSVDITIRRYDFSFVGHEHAGRTAFKTALEETNWDRIGVGKIEWTDRYRGGLDIDAYARLLGQTKIALCPPGQHSPETFRHHEALMAGCVVLTQPLPPHEIYQTSPHVTIRDWRQTPQTLIRLLRDPAELQARSQQAARWWAQTGGPAAVAKRVCEEIHQLL